MPYRHILATTDFSEAANHILTYAFEEATLHEAEITLLHVLQHHTEPEVYYVKGAPGRQMGFEADIGGTLPTPRVTPQTVVRDYPDEALGQLRSLVPASFKGAWHTEVATGAPADAIVRMAERLHVDLLVMGTHGRSGLPHVLLGSVAEKVIRQASCPVLIIRYNKASE